MVDTFNKAEQLTDARGRPLVNQHFDATSGAYKPGNGKVGFADLLAGERQMIAQVDGGVLATIPATTHYIRCPAGQATVLKAPDSTGGIDDYIIEVFYNVTTSATSTITVTDGAGVVLDGALSAWPLLGANAPTGPNRIPDIRSLRSKTGAWTVTLGAGVDAVVGVITK